MPQSGSGSRWLSVDPLAEKYPGWGPYNYTTDNPERFVDEHGDSAAMYVNREGAGGNGHATLYYQDKGGKWYSYDEGATEGHGLYTTASLVSGAKVKGGVVIRGASAPMKGSVLVYTGTSKDKIIYNNAIKSYVEYSTGQKKYNLYSNNCLDAACAVLKASGIKVEIPLTTIRPNSWFQEMKDATVQVPIQGTTGSSTTPSDATRVNVITVPKYKLYGE